MPIAIADEEYTHFRNIVKLKTSAYGELDSIPKMCEEQLQRLQSANCTIIDKEFWVFFRLHDSLQFHIYILQQISHFVKMGDLFF